MSESNRLCWSPNRTRNTVRRLAVLLAFGCTMSPSICAPLARCVGKTAEPQEVLAIRDVRFVVPVESKLNKSKKSVLRWTQARTSTLIRSRLIIIVHTAPYHNQSSGHSYLSSTTHYTSQSVRPFRQFVGALSLSGNVSMWSSCPRQPFYPSGTL